MDKQISKEEIIRQLYEVFATTESESVATIMADAIDFINGVK